MAIFDLKTDFSAIGDGVTDDSAAVFAALDYCGCNGVDLRVPKGTYLVSQAYTFKSGFRIVGAGAGSIFKLAAGSTITAGSALFALLPGVGTTIENLVIDGNKASNASLSIDGFRVPSAVSDLSMRNVVIKNMPGNASNGSGITIATTLQDLAFSEIRCESNDNYGILVTDGDDIVFDNCECTGNGVDGINISGAARVSITGGRCYNNAGDNIAYGLNTSGMTLFGTVAFITGDTAIDSLSAVNDASVGTIEAGAVVYDSLDDPGSKFSFTDGPVTSVFGRLGAVVAVAKDYDLSQVTTAMIDAADYGVTADGTTDDTAAMRLALAAITSLRVSRAPGTGITQYSQPTLVLPTGKILISDEIGDLITTGAAPQRYHYGPVTIIGSDTIIALDDADTTTDILTLMNSQRTTIRGVVFQNGRRHVNFHFGTSSGTEGASASVNVNATMVHIVDCVFQNSEEYPIYAVSESNGSATKIAQPKHLLVEHCKFENCGGGVYNYTNRLEFRHNWCEYTKTNPVIYNIGESVVTDNDVLEYTGTPPDYWLVNAGTMVVRDNRFGSEGTAATRPGILHITKTTIGAETFVAAKSSLDTNDCFAGTAKPIVKIDTIPRNVSIINNLVGACDGYIVDDDYLSDWQSGSSSTAADGRPAVTYNTKNVFRGNILSSVGSLGSIANFKRGGALFDHSGSPETLAPSTVAALQDLTTSWTATAVTATADYGQAPDGTTKSVRLQGTANGTYYLNFTAGGTTGMQTVSIWARSHETGYLNLQVQNTGMSINYGGVRIGGGDVTTDGWQRYDFQVYLAAAGSYRAIFYTVASVGDPVDMEVWNLQVNDGKTPRMFDYPHARIYMSAAQSIPDATSTTLSFDTVRSNVGAMWVVGSPTVFTIPVAGRYAVGGWASWASNATGNRNLWIRLNAGGTFLARDLRAATTSLTDQTLSTEWDFAAGDTVDIRGYQDSGGPLDATVEFWIRRVR